MFTGLAVLLFLLGTTGSVVSFISVYRRKRSGTKYASVIAAGIFSCVIAVLSAGYLAATLLLLGGID